MECDAEGGEDCQGVAADADLFKSFQSKVNKQKPKPARKAKADHMHRRQLKTCPICLGQNYQMARHLSRVHKDASIATMNAAKKLTAPYSKPAPRNALLHPENKCPICSQYRKSPSRHLRRVHNVTRDSPELKGKQNKTDAVRAVVLGKYADLQQVLDKYQKEHFENLCGEGRSLKPETYKRTVCAKLNSLKKMLRWLVDRTGKTDIADLLLSVNELGAKDGYFGENPKASAHKEVGYLKKLAAFLGAECDIPESVEKNCSYKLKNLSANLRRLQAQHVAHVKEASKSRRISETDIQSFYESEICSKAIKILETRPDDILNVRLADVTTIRNFLLFRLMERNFLRPCSLYRLPMSDVLEASVNSDGDLLFFEIPIYCDKTIVTSAEPSYLHVSESEMQWIRNYAHHYRPRLVPVNQEADKDLFLSRGGSILDDQGISRCTRKIWTLAGKDIAGFPSLSNSRDLRASRNANVYEGNSDGLKKAMPKLLNHSLKTNEGTYRRFSRSTESGRAKKEYFDNFAEPSRPEVEVASSQQSTPKKKKKKKKASKQPVCQNKNNMSLKDYLPKRSRSKARRGKVPSYLEDNYFLN